jgi:UDPglucose--hexose-1-phosphate uridylyltransferase
VKSEIRENKATKQRVIYAAARAKRPNDFATPGPQRAPLPASDKDCPFCPVNERALTTRILELPESGTRQTRVIPNKYPALTPDGDTSRIRRGIYVAMPGFGRHEVIIETPLHNRDLAQMSVAEVGNVIETYHRRYRDLKREHANMMIIIFRNHGPRAGTSVIHPHSQLIVTGIVPWHIRHREEEAQRYFDDWGRCVYCEILSFELRDRRRVVFENDSFAAFVPFAAEVPFELWVMPKRHQADFGYISEQEKGDFALALKEILSRLDHKLHDPDYNYVISTSARYHAAETQLHWYLQIQPRLTTRAGFEIGSGISINPSLPELDADFLNSDQGASPQTPANQRHKASGVGRKSSS